MSNVLHTTYMLIFLMMGYRFQGGGRCATIGDMIRQLNGTTELVVQLVCNSGFLSALSTKESFIKNVGKLPFFLVGQNINAVAYQCILNMKHIRDINLAVDLIREIWEQAYHLLESLYMSNPKLNKEFESFLTRMLRIKGVPLFLVTDTDITNDSYWAINSISIFEECDFVGINIVERMLSALPIENLQGRIEYLESIS